MLCRDVFFVDSELYPWYHIRKFLTNLQEEEKTMPSAEIALAPRHKTILPQAVRYFVRSDFRLSKSGKNLGKGATVMLGPIVPLQYDHRTQDAVPFMMNGCEYYLIIDEIQLAGLREELVELTKRPHLTIAK
jgi:hypothetical protein